MNEIDAIILGIIQGLTEFLPVSSSGHLEITRELLDTNQLPSDNLLMTSVLHFATALSTILVFRKDIYNLIIGFFDKENKTSKSYVIKILIAIVPAGLVGFLFSDEIEFLFSGNMTLVGIMLIITGDIFDNEFKISILIIGFISSFLTGVLACKLMLKIVANNNLIYFSFYCFLLGIISIFII